MLVDAAVAVVRLVFYGHLLTVRSLACSFALVVSSGAYMRDESTAIVPWVKSRSMAAKGAKASVWVSCLASLRGARQWLYVLKLMLHARQEQLSPPTLLALAVDVVDAFEVCRGGR